MKRVCRTKQWSGLFLFLVIVWICVIIETKDAYALDYAIEHSLNAKIYKTAEYAEGGSGITLTATGATVSGWNYNESRYLQVNIMVVPKEEEVHFIEIKLPSIFYAVNDVEEIPNGFFKMEFNQNLDFLTNNDIVLLKASHGLHLIGIVDYLINR
jgi:hypothetical protein